MRNNFFSFLLLQICCLAVITKAQPYAPPAGQAGSSAIHKDSSVFVNWAKACQVLRGYQDVSDFSLGLTSTGDSSMATGKAQNNGIVSLGDGGTAICTFQNAIKNGPGFDFAVFENGFNDSFLELAFVEVSSDGVNFVRFASHCLSDTANQFGNAALIDATKLNNLAGKYRAGFGTPFDLQELSGKANLDINAITHVKIIDVVGSLLRAYATFDSFGNKINDPWPTPFPSGGFDLDAVGVIHEQTITGIEESRLQRSFLIYPNPVNRNAKIKLIVPFNILSYELLDFSGKILLNGYGNEIEIPNLDEGVYVLKATDAKGTLIKKIVIQ